MNKEKAKIEAERIIEKIAQFVNSKPQIITCAKLHVEGIIQVLEKLSDMTSDPFVQGWLLTEERQQSEILKQIEETK